MSVLAGTNPMAGGFGAYWNSPRSNWIGIQGVGVAIGGAFHVINARDEIYIGKLWRKPRVDDSSPPKCPSL